MAKKYIGIVNFSNSRREAIIDLNNLINLTDCIDNDLQVLIKGGDTNFKVLYNMKMQINGMQAIKKLSSIYLPYVSNKYIYDKNTIGIIDTILHISFKNYNINDNITFELEIKVNNPTTTFYYIKCYVEANTLNQYKFYDKQSSMVASNMESFMLLRTNPKLTGNVKLVVTEDNKLYLDAFKVSATSVLNNKSYRHKEVSADGDYAHDVYTVFGDLPKGEMYSIYPDSLNPLKNRYSLNDLIENIYEYGAEFNNDSLYSENMRLLAPLYIGKHLPTYFAIFKTAHNVTADYNQTSKEMFTQMLKEAEVIKIFDLRQSTVAGKYLNNFKSSVDTYLSGVCNLLFVEQEAGADSSDYHLGKNTWKGISYAKGIFTESTETSYFATQTLNGKAAQEKYDMFLVNGFSRNGLLYPNIINLEFMFNDPNAEDFKMYNYFGLYLTENPFKVFNLISIEKDEVGNEVVKYINEENIVETEPLKTLTELLNDNNYSDRLFFMSTLSNAASIKTPNDAHTFIKLSALNLPDKNLVLIYGSQINFEDTEKSFITIKFSEQIQKGEHFRFIVSKDEKQKLDKNKVLEVIASDDERLLAYDDLVNPFISTNTGDFAYSDAENTEIYRLTFYVNDIEDPTQLAPLSLQLDRLAACLAKFDAFVYVLDKTDDGLSIVSNYENTVCQHILGEIYDINKAETKEDYIHFFAANNYTTCYCLSSMTDLFKPEHLKYSLTGLETMGSRYSSIIKFINTKVYKNNYVYQIAKDLYKELTGVLNPLISVDSTMMYAPIIKHKIEEGEYTYPAISSSFIKSTFEDYNTILSPFDLTASLVVSSRVARPFNNMLNICSPLKCNISLMGINDIKDIDMYVDHSVSERYKPLTTASFAANEHVKVDNSDVRLRKCVTYKLLKGGFKDIPLSSGTVFMFTLKEIYFFDNSKSGGSYNDVSIREYKDNFVVFNEDTEIELLNTEALDSYDYTVSLPKWSEANFYIEPTKRQKLYNQSVGAFSQTVSLAMPLIPSVNCKWRSNGEYFDNVNVLDTLRLKTGYKQAIGNFIENTYVPTSDTNSQYVINSIDDPIKLNGELTTFREVIMAGSYKGSIKKFLISNFLPQTAIGFYNPNVQTLDFIYYGMKFTLKLTNAKYANEIHLNEYNNYEVFIMNEFTDRPNEMFISTDEQFILFINHQYKADGLHYTPTVKSFKANPTQALHDVSYGVYTAQYSYALLHTSFIKGNYYLLKTASKVMNPLDDYVIELDLPEYEANTDFAEQPVFVYVGAKQNKNFKSTLKYDVIGQDPSTNLYDIMGAVYDPSSLTTIIKYDASVYEDLMKAYESAYGIDFRTKHTYALRKSKSGAKKPDYSQKITKFIRSIEEDLDMYFINNGLASSLNITSDYKPMSISLSYPKNIKYNQGLFNICFNKIFEFETFDNIADKIGLDTLYANTLLKNINYIPTYYYWKIMSGNNICALNYFKVDKRNVCSTDWDSNIYRLYDTNASFKYQQGYATGVTDKMFFASKCLNMHSDSIKLTTWTDKNNTAYVQTSKQGEQSQALSTYTISINLSDTFNTTFLNNKAFRDNWSTYQADAQCDSYITNYIKNTLLNYYDLNNVEIELYSRYNKKDLTIDESFVRTLPADLHYFKTIGNFKTNIEKVADSVRLTINITDDYAHNKYYPVIKIKKH